MKILMINSVCGINSTGKICIDLANELSAKGDTIRIAYGRGKVPQMYQSCAVRIGSEFDVAMHGIKSRAADRCGFGSKAATERFLRWVKEYDPDIIHLHNIHGYYLDIKALFSYLRTCGKTIVWTLHDSWPFTGHSAYCDSIPCEKWKTGCSHCPLQKDYPKSFIDQSEQNWKDKRQLLTGVPNLTIVTPSQWLASQVGKSFLSSYPVKVIHNGIDTSVFCPRNTEHGEGPKENGAFTVLGVASTWTRIKGFDDFLQLAEEVGKVCRIVLVGVSKKQKKKLPSTIQGIVHTSSSSELAAVYSKADLFVNLTYCDTYPTVNLEARACNTPVLTYDTGGCRETIDQNSGILVARGKVEEVSRRIIDYVKKHPTKPLLHTDKSELDCRTTAERYSALYTELMQNRSPGIG